jgi:peptidoglycan/LPS O-acetylase OafA/YrhL
LSGHEHISKQSLGLWLGLGILMIPILPWMHAGDNTYAFNWPSWSLPVELVANVFHALVLRHGRTARTVVLILSGAGIVLGVARWGTLNFGFMPSQILYAIPRVLFPYTLGIVLFEMWNRKGLSRLGLSPLWSSVALLAVLATPALTGVAEYVFEAAVLVVVFPLVLLAGASSVVPERVADGAEVLGRISYAVYILHGPISQFFPWVLLRVGRRSIGGNAPWGGIALLGVILFVSWAAERFYDRPVRAWLQGRKV